MAGAARTIDAEGLVVAPGFIDHHTHMDGQILWDPFGTCEPQHGVTSIIMGNCGLALAPVKSGDEDALVKSFVRVEAIPRIALEKGVPWGWKSYGDYLNKLEGKRRHQCRRHRRPYRRAPIRHGRGVDRAQSD